MAFKSPLPRWLLIQGTLVVLACIVYQFIFNGTPNHEPVEIELSEQCEQPMYTTRLLSYDPLIIHIENFITLKERRHLLEVA